MRSRRYFWACAVLLFALASSTSLAQKGHGHGNGHGKHGDHDDDDDNGRQSYNKHDRDEMEDWYHGHRGQLPPGLAKRDHLPPGLERQLVVRGTLPPGLRKKVQDCPPDLERRLPPPPRDCRHVVVEGHIVLLNTRSFVIVDVFHFGH